MKDEAIGKYSSKIHFKNCSGFKWVAVAIQKQFCGLLLTLFEIEHKNINTALRKLVLRDPASDYIMKNLKTQITACHVRRTPTLFRVHQNRQQQVPFHQQSKAGYFAQLKLFYNELEWHSVSLRWNKPSPCKYCYACLCQKNHEDVFILFEVSFS